MNVAFPTLLVAAIAAPGGLFLELYRRGLENRAFNPASIPTKAAMYLVFAVPVHLLTAALVIVFNRTVVFGLGLVGVTYPRFVVASVDDSLRIRGRFILALLVGPQGDQGLYATAYAWLATHLWTFFGYFILAGLVGAFLGLRLHQIINSTGLDSEFAILRTQSEFWYLFSSDVPTLIRRGYLVYHPLQTVRNRDLPDFVFVTAAVMVNNRAYLYWGILTDYELDTDDSLKRLMLSDARRRPMDNDLPDGEERGTPAEDDRFYPIEGDVFVLDYDQVLSLNIEYAFVADSQEPDDGAVEGEYSFSPSSAA